MWCSGGSDVSNGATIGLVPIVLLVVLLVVLVTVAWQGGDSGGGSDF